jgi:hypothetical protein
MKYLLSAISFFDFDISVPYYEIIDSSTMVRSMMGVQDDGVKKDQTKIEGPQVEVEPSLLQSARRRYSLSTATLCLCSLTHSYLMISVFSVRGLHGAGLRVKVRLIIAQRLFMEYTVSTYLYYIYNLGSSFSMSFIF